MFLGVGLARAVSLSPPFFAKFPADGGIAEVRSGYSRSNIFAIYWIERICRVISHRSENIPSGRVWAMAPYAGRYS